jgi:vacuolar-type H+-ATPase subunit I/STV1
MSTILTNEEKSGIISQHIKNVEYSLYNLSLSLIEENAVSSPDEDKISSLNDQIADLNAQKTALQSELSNLV